MTLARQARSPARRGPNPALRLAAIRRWHSYLGAFIAPSVLFFAFTGSLQLFTLHEAHDTYRPPLLVEKLGMLHKDQVFAAKPERPRPPSAKPAPPRPPEARKAPARSAEALKLFFAFVAASLAVSTLLGLWMGFAYSAQKARLMLLFLAGAAVPLALLTLL